MKEVFDLSKFDEYKEDNRREVKSAKGGLPGSLWDTYSAMANTYGGVIILGVKENTDGSWYTTGLKDVSRLKKDFWNTINNQTKVSINLLQEKDVTDYEKDGDVILVIYVPAADRENKPVYLNQDLFGSTFKRNNEGDYHCTRAEIQAMLRDETRVTMDTKVLQKMKVADFDQDTIRSYKLWLESKRPGHVFLSQSNDDFLESIGAARIADDGVIHPTSAGLLMFGKEYKILYEFEQYLLDYREHLSPEVRWTDRIMSQSGDWSGNVFDFFVRVSAKLTLDLKKPFKLVNMVRQDETPVHDAVREALVNCLVNTDFYEPRGVVIEKYPDQIVLQNPGTVIVGKKQMLRGGLSEPRNGALMKMFHLIGYGERAGSGVPDIYATWDNAGFADPIVEEQFGSGQPNRTIVTLPLVEKDLVVSGPQSEKGPEKGPEKDQKFEQRIESVLSMVKENPSISRKKIAERLNISEKQVRLAIDTLKIRNIIHHEGPNNGGTWVID